MIDLARAFGTSDPPHWRPHVAPGESRVGAVVTCPSGHAVAVIAAAIERGACEVHCRECDYGGRVQLTGWGHGGGGA